VGDERSFMCGMLLLGSVGTFGQTIGTTPQKWGDTDRTLRMGTYIYAFYSLPHIYVYLFKFSYFYIFSTVYIF